MLKTMLRKFTAPKAPVAPKPCGQRLETIMVPRSAMDRLPGDPYPMVQSVVDFTNHLTQAGRFTRNEIPVAAMRGYHCDYYLAQVLNGGHAQFVGNSGALLPLIIDDILTGLEAMGARNYLELARSMADWVAANPDEAALQTGFTGGIAAELAALDAPFFALNRSQPLQRFIADWIAGQPNLKVIDDVSLPSVLSAMMEMNPEFETRDTALEILTLEQMFSDPLRIGLGMAGAGAPGIEPLVAIAGGSQMQVAGEPQIVWSLRTAQAARFGTMTQDAATIYERIEHDNGHLGVISGPEDLKNITMDDIRKYKAPEVGAAIHAVPIDKIKAAQKLCDHLDVAAAISLLSRKLSGACKVDYASVRSAGPDGEGRIGVSLFLVSDNGCRAMSSIIREDGAILLSEPTHETLAVITRAEITAHRDIYQLPQAA